MGVYLNTATMGLPPRRAVGAGFAALRAWQAGRRVAPDFDLAVERSRSAFAEMVGVQPGEVAIGPQVMVFTVSWLQRSRAKPKCSCRPASSPA
jgi:hypothetical protein